MLQRGVSSPAIPHGVLLELDLRDGRVQARVGTATLKQGPVLHAAVSHLLEHELKLPTMAAPQQERQAPMQRAAAHTEAGAQALVGMPVDEEAAGREHALKSSGATGAAAAVPARTTPGHVVISRAALTAWLTARGRPIGRDMLAQGS